MAWYQKSMAGMEEFYHPFFDLKTLYSPDRKTNVFIPFIPSQQVALAQSQQEEKFCAFCAGNILLATPDKNRISRSKTHELRYHKYPGIENFSDEIILFRHQANLFETLNFEYWHQKFGIDSTESELEQIYQDLKNPSIKEYLTNLMLIKNKRLNKKNQYDSQEQFINDIKSFYSGFHDLITSGFHYCPNLKDGRLFSSRSLNFEDHRISYHLMIKIMLDMIKKNKYISFIAIFQNWMHPAGASFDHWHKQILALDFWGLPLEREAQMFSKNKNIYKEFAIDTATQEDLFIAENKHAIAYVEIGAKTGMITICSKSKQLRPFEHAEEEINSMSDLSHAIISCLEEMTPYNEEWFYTPLNNNNFMTPWRIIINLRSTVMAGLENITQIGINPISPKELAETMRIKLLSNIKNGSIEPNISIHPKKCNLLYNEKK